MNNISTLMRSRQLWVWLVMLGTALVSGRTWAACTNVPATTYHPFAVVSQNPNAPVGGVLANLQVTTAATVVARCDSLASLAAINFNAPTLQLVSGYTDVYYALDSTGKIVPSIGIRLTPANIPGDSLPIGNITFPSKTWTAQVIRVTNDVPGTLNVCPARYWRAGVGSTWGPETYYPLVIGEAGPFYACTLQVTVGNIGTCNVTTSSVAIALGSVNPNSMPSVGSTSPTSSTQNVSLNCSGNPSVAMTMSGTAASGYNNVLALAPGTGVAAGAGVQLIYNSNPLVFNQSYSITSSAPSTLTVPIAARYYRTGTLSPGPANANATLNFSYN